MLPSWLSRLFGSVKTTNALALFECLILAFIAFAGWRELASQQRQHELERLFAGKSSVQGVNDLILRDSRDGRDDKEVVGQQDFAPRIWQRVSRGGDSKYRPNRQRGGGSKYRPGETIFLTLLVR